MTIATVELDELVEFYAQLLTQRPTVYVPEVYGEFEVSGLRLGLFKPKASHRSEFKSTTTGPLSLCLEVDDLEATMVYLAGLECAIKGSISLSEHGREVYAYDPAGNRLILHQSHH